jgi:glutathione S-transferase
MYLFNCAQRAHHNFIENYPAALSALLVSGLAYPRLAAAAGAVWMVGRVVYALGYTRRAEWNVEGKGRFSGGGFYVAAVGQVVLMGLVGKMGVELLGA